MIKKDNFDKWGRKTNPKDSFGNISRYNSIDENELLKVDEVENLYEFFFSKSNQAENELIDFPYLKNSMRYLQQYWNKLTMLTYCILLTVQLVLVQQL